MKFTSAEVEQHRNHSFEYRMMAADGRVVWMRNIVNVIVDGTRASEVVGVSVDITDFDVEAAVGCGLNREVS